MFRNIKVVCDTDSSAGMSAHCSFCPGWKSPAADRRGVRWEAGTAEDSQVAGASACCTTSTSFPTCVAGTLTGRCGMIIWFDEDKHEFMSAGTGINGMKHGN